MRSIERLGMGENQEVKNQFNPIFSSQIISNTRNSEAFIKNNIFTGKKFSINIPQISDSVNNEFFLQSNQKIFLKKNLINKTSHRNLIHSKSSNKQQFPPLYQNSQISKEYSGQKFLNRSPIPQQRIKTENDKYKN